MANLSINIGRSSSSDYVIPNPDQHPTVSGNHATICQINKGDVSQFKYVDHSTNGSYINGEFIHNGEKVITSGDHITLGRTYTLDLTSIITCYFDSSKTTKKKEKKETNFVAPPMIDPVPPIAGGDGTWINPAPEVVESPVPAPLPQDTSSKNILCFVFGLLAGVVIGYLIAMFSPLYF